MFTFSFQNNEMRMRFAVRPTELRPRDPKTGKKQ